MTGADEAVEGPDDVRRAMMQDWMAGLGVPDIADAGEIDDQTVVDFKAGNLPVGDLAVITGRDVREVYDLVWEAAHGTPATVPAQQAREESRQRYSAQRGEMLRQMQANGMPGGGDWTEEERALQQEIVNRAD